MLPIHTCGDTNDLDNYRPISRLPCLAKILESLINVQLCSSLSDNCILNVNQSGFRPGHSTTTAATLVVNDIVNALDAKKSCASLFIDLSKTFDTVDHSVLQKKLSRIGLGYTACLWFQSYLSDRTQAILTDAPDTQLV